MDARSYLSAQSVPTFTDAFNRRIYMTVAAVAVLSIVTILIVVLATRDSHDAAKQRKILRIILSATGAVLTFAMIMFIVHRLRLASNISISDQHRSARLLQIRIHTFLAIVGMALWTTALVFSLVDKKELEPAISPLIIAASAVVLLQALILIPKWGITQKAVARFGSRSQTSRPTTGVKTLGSAEERDDLLGFIQDEPEEPEAEEIRRQRQAEHRHFVSSRAPREEQEAQAVMDEIMDQEAAAVRQRQGGF